MIHHFLDVLLQDLEATIPSNTNQQANSELNDEFIQDLDSKMGLFLPNKSDSFSSLQPVEVSLNLSSYS